MAHANDSAPRSLSPEDQAIQSKLAPPGAGIPWSARLGLRFYLKPFVIRRTLWEENERQFLSLHGKLMREIDGVAPERLTERVLVPPQQGLEDSSRYWSIAMTARHLTIVGQGIERSVIALSHGKAPPVKVDIAKVKPESELNDAASIAEYAGFAESVLERIRQGVVDKNSTATLDHPWFGAMKSKDWLWLLGAHTAIHLKQIRAIKAGFKS